MSRRHLCSTDELPPLKKDVLRLYSMLYCPFAARPQLVLAHKQVPFEIVNIDLGDKPAWFFERNPNGGVPILEQDDKVLYESGVIMDYVDEAFPGPKLTPTNPFIKAKARLLGVEFDKVVTAFYKLMRSSKEDQKANLEGFLNLMERFHGRIPDTKYLAGDEITMIDYHCWPFIARFFMGKSDFDLDLLPDGRFPKLHSWISMMKEVPSVQTIHVDPKDLATFYKMYFTGKTDYDFALKE